LTKTLPMQALGELREDSGEKSVDVRKTVMQKPHRAEGREMDEKKK